MEGGGSSGDGKQGDAGEEVIPWSTSIGGDAPLPPVFGNANAQAGGGDMDFKVGGSSVY